MAGLWESCASELKPGEISGSLLRIVESQEQVATTGLVDNLHEQSVLEDMLERTKPPKPAGTEKLHYLLATPFRYPPLRHGSRFGGRFEPSLFYGSLSIHTLLSEAAYYRYVFWDGMAEPPPSGRFMTQHTVFGARYRAAPSARLQYPPCAKYEKQLTDPSRYEVTQKLGSAMRGAGIQVFEYISARDPEKGLNVALFTPAALVSKQPLHQQQWLCETTTKGVSFSRARENELHIFPLERFLVDGELPQPAV